MRKFKQTAPWSGNLIRQKSRKSFETFPLGNQKVKLIFECNLWHLLHESVPPSSIHRYNKKIALIWHNRNTTLTQSRKHYKIPKWLLTKQSKKNFLPHFFHFHWWFFLVWKMQFVFVHQHRRMENSALNRKILDFHTYTKNSHRERGKWNRKHRQNKKKFSKDFESFSILSPSQQIQNKNCEIDFPLSLSSRKSFSFIFMEIELLGKEVDFPSLEFLLFYRQTNRRWWYNGFSVSAFVLFFPKF